MTKLLCNALLLLSFGTGFVACYDDKADIAFYSGEQLIDQVGTCTNFVSSVTLYANSSNASDNIGIAYGKGGYQAVSSDADVVKVAIKGERLLLTAGSKSGKATVTVTDEKGNQAVLAVQCGTGTINMECIQSAAAPMIGSQVQSDIRDAVAEAMRDYNPISEGEKFILTPADMSNWVEGGKLVYESADGTAIEGTYSSSVAEDVHLTLKFAYGDENHVFEITGEASSSDDSRVGGSRMTGHIPFYLKEDITALFKEKHPDINLDDAVSVYYVVKIKYLDRNIN